MQDPRPVRACRASSYSAYAANDGLNIKTEDCTLPRAFGGGTPGEPTLLRLFRHQQEANAVRVFRSAREKSQCVYLFAYGYAPRKSLVEHARLSRPPPSGECTRTKRAGKMLEHLPG